MKIAIPANEADPDSDVCISFGRAPYFIIADTGNGKFKVIKNKAASEQGGAGIKAAQVIADSGAQAVVAFHCGENAADVLEEAGIKIYKAVNGTAADMAKKYAAGKLGGLKEIRAGTDNGN